MWSKQISAAACTTLYEEWQMQAMVPFVNGCYACVSKLTCWHHLIVAFSKWVISHITKKDSETPAALLCVGFHTFADVQHCFPPMTNNLVWHRWFGCNTLEWWDGKCECGVSETVRHPPIHCQSDSLQRRRLSRELGAAGETGFSVHTLLNLEN